MRKIIVGLHISLDGVIEAPEKWSFPYYTDEIGAFIGQNMGSSDALLLGRVTYEGFQAAFSSQTGGIADVMNGKHKYVVSTKLTSAEWINSTLIQRNILEEIAKLKAQPGQNIAISGSASLVKSLMAHDLIDEYALLMYPLVLGSGARLFPDGIPQSTLSLLEAKSTPKGVMLLRYERERK